MPVAVFCVSSKVKFQMPRLVLDRGEELEASLQDRKECDRQTDSRSKLLVVENARRFLPLHQGDVSFYFAER